MVGAMKIMNIAALTGLLAASVPVPAAAAPLQPTAKWNVDFGEAHCIAMRNYGTKEAPILLAFKPAPLGDIIQMSVVRPGSNKDISEYGGTMVVDGSPPVPISVLGFPAPSGKARVDAINLPLPLFDPLREAKAVRLKSFGELSQEFALSDMAPVARALDRCMVDLREHWHIGAAASQIATEAKSITPLRRLFSSHDYPQVALRAGASGVVRFMVLIDEAGKVASCMVTESSGYASLDAQSCAIITRRASFTPAIGRDGKPTRSGNTVTIRWKRGV